MDAILHVGQPFSWPASILAKNRIRPTDLIPMASLESSKVLIPVEVEAVDTSTFEPASKTTIMRQDESNYATSAVYEVFFYKRQASGGYRLQRKAQAPRNNESCQIGIEMGQDEDASRLSNLFIRFVDCARGVYELDFLPKRKSVSVATVRICHG